MDDEQFLALLAGHLYVTSDKYDTQLDAIAGAQFFIKEACRALSPPKLLEQKPLKDYPCDQCHTARRFRACPGCGHVAE